MTRTRILRQASVDAGLTSDHADYFRFARRTMRALVRRVGASDPDDLSLLLDLRDELDAGLGRAVAELRASGFSWSEIARPLGMTRQAAQQRWGGPVVDDDAQRFEPRPVAVVSRRAAADGHGAVAR
jgi:hypothetical protein